MASIFRPRAAAALALMLLAHASRAARCPDCDIKYANCAWNCYNTVGWEPVCVDLVTAKAEATGATPDPASFLVYPSQCDADCYLEHLGELNQLVKVDTQYEQTTATSCEGLWKTKAAQEAIDFQTSPFASGLDSLPEWLQTELEKAGNTTDTAALDTAWEKCLVCDANTAASPPPKAASSSPPPPAKEKNSSPPPSPVASPPLSPTSSPPESFSPPPSSPPPPITLSSPPPPVFSPPPSPIPPQRPPPVIPPAPAPTPSVVPLSIPPPPASAAFAPATTQVMAMLSLAVIFWAFLE